MVEATHTKKTTQRPEQAGEVRRLTRTVQGAVDDGATTVEEIHKAIAEAPLDVLERMAVLPRTMADIRRAQDDALTAIYRAVRKVNHAVTDFTADLLEGARPKRPAVHDTGSKAQRPDAARRAREAEKQSG